MTRQDYIAHLDLLRKGVVDLMEYDRRKRAADGDLANPTFLETDRAKKTQKMFEDLAVRLYEDAGVSEKVKIEKIEAGDLGQAEMTFTDEMAERAAGDMARAVEAERRREVNQPKNMSRPEAAFVLMEMSRGGGVTRRECEALQTAVRSLVKRHFDCMKSRANRKARKDEERKDHADGK